MYRLTMFERPSSGSSAWWDHRFRFGDGSSVLTWRKCKWSSSSSNWIILILILHKRQRHKKLDGWKHWWYISRFYNGRTDQVVQFTEYGQTSPWLYSDGVRGHGFDSRQLTVLIVEGISVLNVIWTVTSVIGFTGDKTNMPKLTLPKTNHNTLPGI